MTPSRLLQRIAQPYRRAETDALYQALLRKRFAHEAQAHRARMWARVEARYGHLSKGIARDIRENRVEA